MNYMLENRGLSKLDNDPVASFLHFCCFGLLGRRHFRVYGWSVDELSELGRIDRLPVDDLRFKLIVRASFGRALVLSRYRDDRPALPAHCDALKDSDISKINETVRYGGRPFVVFGDSHSRLYARMTRILQDGRWLIPINMTCSAGSARGLANPKSRLNYASRIRSFFYRLQDHILGGLPCFFKLGQVDVEYTYYYRWANTGRRTFDADDFCGFADETIHLYVHFLTDLVSVDIRPFVTICSLSPPALSDEHWLAGYLDGQLLGTSSAEERERLSASVANLNIPDIIQRTALHTVFSRKLKSAVEKEGFSFVDDASVFLDPEGRQLDPRYNCRRGGRDVHIDVDEPAMSTLERVLSLRMAPPDYLLASNTDKTLLEQCAASYVVDQDVKGLVLSYPWRLERPNGDVRSEFVSFAPDGRIAGYEHPNEVSWDIFEGNLALRNAAGKITCLSSTIHRERESGRHIILMAQASNANLLAHRLLEISPDDCL